MMIERERNLDLILWRALGKKLALLQNQIYDALVTLRMRRKQMDENQT